MPARKSNTGHEPPPERLEALEQTVEELATDVGALRRELAAAGVGRSPNPARPSPLSAEQRRAINARNAARARAAKAVGKGCGKVRTSATKQRLVRAAAGLDPDEDE